MGKNVATVLVAAVGLTLLGWAALDWVAYTGFSISLVWR